MEARISSISEERGLDFELDGEDDLGVDEDDEVMREYGDGDDLGELSRLDGGKSSVACSLPADGGGCAVAGRFEVDS